MVNKHWKLKWPLLLQREQKNFFGWAKLIRVWSFRHIVYIVVDKQLWSDNVYLDGLSCCNENMSPVVLDKCVWGKTSFPHFWCLSLVTCFIFWGCVCLVASTELSNVSSSLSGVFGSACCSLTASHCRINLLALSRVSSTSTWRAHTWMCIL